MARTGRDERHELLKKRIEENPFINDEELAEEFSVSIATIRLDRMALGIPELRIRIKQRAVAAGPETKLAGVLGELVECVPGESVCIMAVGNVKYKQPVTVGDKLVARAEVIRRRDDKRYVWVKIRKNAKEVFRAKFIIESLE